MIGLVCFFLWWAVTLFLKQDLYLTQVYLHIARFVKQTKMIHTGRELFSYWMISKSQVSMELVSFSCLLLYFYFSCNWDLRLGKRMIQISGYVGSKWPYPALSFVAGRDWCASPGYEGWLKPSYFFSGCSGKNRCFPLAVLLIACCKIITKALLATTQTTATVGIKYSPVSQKHDCCGWCTAWSYCFHQSVTQYDMVACHCASFSLHLDTDSDLSLWKHT